MVTIPSALSLSAPHFHTYISAALLISQRTEFTASHLLPKVLSLSLSLSMRRPKLEKLFEGIYIALSILALHVRSLEEKDGVVGAGTWCVAKQDASSTDLQAALDWACGEESGQGNVNCAPILTGGVCDSPDTVAAHASYAFNAYFQNLNQAAGACDFNGCAETTTSDPSLGACTYQSSATSSGVLTTANVSNSSPSDGASNGGSMPRVSLLSLVWSSSIVLCSIAPFMLEL